MEATIHVTDGVGADLVIPLHQVNYMAIPCPCGRLHKVQLVIEEVALPELSDARDND